jgi:large subunit ribosomal protein L29
MAQAQSLADKVRNLTPAELHAREREQSEHLFKLKFQMKMGQTESVKKLRELKKEIARIKTVAREKELGVGPKVVAAPVAEKPAKKASPKKASPKKTAKKVSRKKTEKK